MIASRGAAAPRPGTSLTARAKGTRRRPLSPSLWLGAVLVLLLVGAAGLAPWLAPHDASEVALAQRLEGPSAAHPLGCDDLGRDVLSRLLHGARLSLGIALAVAGLSSIFGAFCGLVGGYWGGWLDEAVMRVADILLAFPGILLAMAVVAVTGQSATNLVVALCLTGWVGHARLARGQALKVRELEFVTAARALGAPDWRIIVVHVLPACLPPLLVQATLGMGGIIVAEAGLSFLGLGVGPSTPSWGSLLLAGTEYLRPHLTVFPGLAIAVAVLGFNLLGDGLRDWLDPRQVAS